jgi:pyruvate,water dikinase
VVGPKSARLVEIRRNTSYRVPPFFVVSIYGYRMFVEATGLEELIHQTLWSSDLGDPRLLRAACASIRSAILGATLPPPLAGAMAESVQRLRAKASTALGFAIRSSAVVEDSVASFAGQFESLLNVLEDGLPEAYKQVLASKYRPETVQYAIASGFLDQEVTMPVMVMSMIEPAASGVAYSQDPENPSRGAVTAVRGLAQAMVEGRVIPDRYLLSREDRWDVVASLRGVQQSMIHCHPAGGVAESSPDGFRDARVALEEENICNVAQAAFTLEKHFGAPQDVEWAIDRTGALFIYEGEVRDLISAS